MSKLKVYMHIAENSGVGYYRQFLPATALRETDKAQILINDFRWGVGNHIEITEKAFFDVCNWADVVVIGRMDRPEYYAKWAAAREYFNIPIVLDTDDNVQHVRPTNPGYAGYHPGSEALHWNKHAMTNIVDAVTVSTDHLKDFYSKVHPRVHVLPNNLDVKHWEAQPEPKKTVRKIKMGFICSSSHADGFGIIQKPVYDILKRYKHVDFYYPYMYKNLFRNAPKSVEKQLKTIPWAPLKKWPKKLKGLGLHIGLAPLKDNNFNRGKSNLRYMEYSLARMAPIVSPVEPYKIVNDGVDGLIAKEQKDWYNQMEKLILDREYLDTIAQNAHDRIVKEYNIWDNVDKWLDTYQAIHDKFHDFYGPKKRYEDMGGGKYKQLAD